ncbi:hypothetical protein [Streptomyces sp. ML-6]|uniref:hypothetical protein n=1 Tax=unclassified Streptomyces TaxID=2593676 RepID=UPI0024C0DA91|nr:hypothetical protein [Streptomyces sp. ML-6]MDK0517750.1 hypothetical protein [Streptomyces sp. ML-6]
MLTATTQRSTTGARPADDHARTSPAAEEAVTMGTHPTTHPAHRPGNDRRTALPAHLFLLHDALTRNAGGRGRETARTATPYPGRTAPRPSGTRQLTLAQWVGRTARIGAAADARPTTG